MAIVWFATELACDVDAVDFASVIRRLPVRRSWPVSIWFECEQSDRWLRFTSA